MIHCRWDRISNAIQHDHLIVNKKKLRYWDTKEKPYRNQKYESLLDYFCNNVYALAVDLAKCNHLTMGELFTKYEG